MRTQPTLSYRINIKNESFIVIQSAVGEDDHSYGHHVKRTPAPDHGGYISTNTIGVIMPTAWEYV